MIELREPEFSKVSPVFEPLQYHLGVCSIIDGYIPGRIWADDADNPKTAVIWDMRYKTIAPDAVKRNIKMYFVICPPYWEKKILKNEVQIDRFPKRMPRCYYAFKQKVVTDWEDRIPPEFALKCVYENLLKGNLDNINTLIEEIEDIIASVDEFIRRGFEGYCLAYRDKVAASWCLSFMYGSSCEFTVQTVEEYQQRGFGTITTSALIDSCLSGYHGSIGWHCGQENVPSMKQVLMKEAQGMN